MCQPTKNVKFIEWASEWQKIETFQPEIATKEKIFSIFCFVIVFKVKEKEK